MDMHRLGRAGVAISLAVLLSGCSLVGRFQGPTPVVADLSVYNRTEEPITLVAGDGEILTVPACGHARDREFRVERVLVGANGLYVHSFGTGGNESGDPLTLVEVASAADAQISTGLVSPDGLPPCRGEPQVQEGVPLFD
jgi:hypothetical protein